MQLPMLPSTRHPFRAAALLMTPLCALLLAAPLRADTVALNSAAAFDNNFVTLPAAGLSTLSIYELANTDYALRKTGSGNQTIIYDTSATGGSDGSGGTSGSRANIFTDVSISADLRFSLGHSSFGLYSRVNNAYTAGYMGYVQLTTAGDVTLRIYDSNSNPLGSTVGSVLLNQSFTPPESVVLNSNTFYTFSFDTITTADDNVLLTVSLSTLGGIEIASASIIDTTSPLLSGGQAGLRAASATGYVHSFSAGAAIPEPSQVAATIALLAGAVIAVRSRRRHQRNR